MRVFIADDSEIVLTRLRAMLFDLSEIEIIGEAINGIEARKAIIKSKPDLVILNIRMPGENGINVLNRIKENHPNVVVIMFADYPSSQYRDKCLGLGADYFFKKSSVYEKVPEVMKQLIQVIKDENTNLIQET